MSVNFEVLTLVFELLYDVILKIKLFFKKIRHHYWNNMLVLTYQTVILTDNLLNKMTY